jgi:hypothetical protein
MVVLTAEGNHNTYTPPCSSNTDNFLNKELLLMDILYSTATAEKVIMANCKGRQNNGNTKKLRNRICVGYTERTSGGKTEHSSSVYLHTVVLMSVL